MRQLLCAGGRMRKHLGRRRNSRTKRLGGRAEQLERRELLAGDLIAHWRAHDLTTTHEDNQTVEVWTDAVEQTEATREGTPVLVTNQFGGRSVVRFTADDGGDAFSIARADSPLSGAEDYSIVIAFATSSSDLTGGSSEWFNNTGLVDASTRGFSKDWGVSINANGQISYGQGKSLNETSRTVYSTASGLNDGQLHVVTVTRQGSELAVYVDNDAPDVVSDADAAPRFKSAVTLGRILNGTGYFTGDMGEVRFYNGQLTSDEVATVHNDVLTYYSNRPPLAVDDIYVVDEDQPLAVGTANSLLTNDIDDDGDNLTAIVDTEPANGELALNENGSFIYVPNTDFYGTDTFTYRAADFRESDLAATVTIEVAPIHDPATAGDDTYKAEPTETLIVPFFQGVLSNDFSVETQELTAKLASDVTDGALSLDSNGSFTYDPQGFSGTATFTYRVDDGTQLSGEATASIVVNSPPTAVTDQYDIQEDIARDVSADLGVLSNDTDADGNDMTAIAATEPQHGILALNEDGSFRYEPNADFFGQDLFGYRVSDGIDATAEVFVQLNVQPVNDAPTAVGDSYFVTPGVPLVVQSSSGVVANDTDIDSTSLTAAVVDQPTRGTLQLGENGSFTYTPNDAGNGVDQFTYRTSDGQDFSEPATVTLRITNQPLIINEFMASNATTITTMLRASDADEFEGEELTPDWIELRNFLNEPVDAGGFHLTDDARLPMKWRIPDGTVIPAQGYLLIFASGEDIVDPSLDQNGALHTSFQLGTGGDYLGLTDAQGLVIHSVGDTYPDQRTHISYGVPGTDAKVFGYFTEPTPGAANNDALVGLVEDTQFSVKRGFFTQPFQVEITTATEGAAIRYTTDGSVPSAEHGNDYAGPITIDATTTLRAAAFKQGLVETNTDTQSYFFTGDIVSQDRQATLDAGFPDRWRGQAPDYGLDSETEFPRIAGDTNMPINEARAAIEESLVSIPSLSIVMNIDDMFGDRGIYSNPTSSGKRWERATSVELLHPDGTEGFQIDAGIRIQGGAFRNFGLTRKKSFRLLFKTQYGPGKLDYPLFGADAVDEFDTLTLRMEANDGWQWNGAGGQPQYARDEFLRRTQLAMGQPASHGTSMHLYINGFYWGLYNVVERPDESFGASYFGSEPYNWDGLNSGSAINAEGDRFRGRRTRDAWTALTRKAREVDRAETEAERTALFMELQGLNPDGSENPELEDLLDVENMIDYLIVNYYGDNSDWPHKNYYVGRENSADSTGFKFFMWDAEWSLFLRSNVTGTSKINNADGVARPAQDLRESLEYRVMFGDRVQKHFFNDGVFYVDPENPDWDPDHPERNRPAASYVDWTSQVYPALLAESARWGDQHRGRPYTRDNDWQREFDRLIEDWFPRRTSFLISQFQRRDLFPEVPAASFNQRGGAITSQFDIELSAPQGTIYYTTDGSDPRMMGGAVSPNAIEYSGSFRLTENSVVRVRALDGEEWSPIDESSFIVDVMPADASSLRVSELHYHPADPTDAEVAAGHNDGDDFEFIELVNISNSRIDLTHVELSQVVEGADEEGVAFTFADGAMTQLAPGERLLVVEDIEAFQFRYGSDLPVAGQWSGGLSNRSEKVTLGAGDTIFQQFTYNDQWHPQSDGQGPSLEVVDPSDPNLARWSEQSGWRASSNPGGSPGIAGELTRVAGDSNGDGKFDSSDLVAVFAAGEYEDETPLNSTFEEGDWNGDSDFTTSDLVFAFQQGNYQRAARPRSSAVGVAAALDEFQSEDAAATVDPLTTRAVLAERGRVPAHLDDFASRDELFALDDDRAEFGDRPSEVETALEQLLESSL